MTPITHAARRAPDITTGETMNITDEQIDAAAASWSGYANLRDNLRAALAAALAAQPQPAEPVAWYVQRQAPGKKDHGMRLGPFWWRQAAEEWVDERHTLHALYAAPQPARVPLSVALPALPEPARTTPVQFGDDGQWFRADQMTAYARQCAAAWGITADTKD